MEDFPIEVEEDALPLEEVDEEQGPQRRKASHGYPKDKEAISRRRKKIRIKIKKRVIIISKVIITKDSTTMTEDTELEILIKTSPSLKRKEEKEEMTTNNLDRK